MHRVNSMGKKIIENMFTLLDNLEIHVDLSCMCFDGGRKPQQLRKPTQTGGEPASKQGGAWPAMIQTHKHLAVRLQC